MRVTREVSWFASGNASATKACSNIQCVCMYYDNCTCNSHSSGQAAQQPGKELGHPGMQAASKEGRQARAQTFGEPAAAAAATVAATSVAAAGTA